MARLDINRIAAPHQRPHLDWHGLHNLRSESQEARNMVQWLTNCLENGRAEQYKEDENTSAAPSGL
jgi:hypothetical protein